MFTARKVFSRSFAASATRAELTACTSSHDLRIENRGGFGRIIRYAADNFRNVVRLEFGIARIDALRREREQKIFVEFQTRLLKHRQQHFVGRARIGRRLENDQLAATQTLLDLFGRGQDVGHVRLFRFPQRRRHADDDRVAVFQLVEIRGGMQLPVIDQLFDLRRCHIADVGFAAN